MCDTSHVDRTQTLLGTSQESRQRSQLRFALRSIAFNCMATHFLHNPTVSLCTQTYPVPQDAPSLRALILDLSCNNLGPAGAQVPHPRPSAGFLSIWRHRPSCHSACMDTPEGLPGLPLGLSTAGQFQLSRGHRRAARAWAPGASPPHGSVRLA